MNNDAIELLRIHTQMRSQWETLSSKVLILAIFLFIISLAMLVMAYRIAHLSGEVEQLKSRQTPRLTALAPATESRFAGDGRRETGTAGN